MKGANNPKLKYETEKHLNNMKQGSNNILVAVRVRPLLPKEEQISAYEIVQVLDQQVVALTDPEKEGNLDVISRKNRDKTTNWAFDFALDKYTTQKQIFDCTTKFLIDGVLEGFNCTVFAYGATGAGKTYTMVGTSEDPGIMPRTLNQLFILVNQQKVLKDIEIKASYLEIYNENIKDLLTQEDKNLEIREDANDGINVINLTEITVNSTTEIMNLLKIGNKNRATDATAANEVSSRSHAVLQISISIQEANQGITRAVQTSKLSLVDLAGSERAAKTNNRGQRLIEGAKINQSLLTLGNCIQSLAEQHEKKNNNNAFIPYRGSKLTRLLKDSLGGNCRTVMISNISPCIDSVEDTYNTLCFAHRAKMIKTNVKRNVTNVENHISNYANVIDGLRKENAQLKKFMVENKKLNSEFGVVPQPGQGKQMEDIVKNNKLREKVTQFEKELNGHFKEECDLVGRIYDLEQKIENSHYQNFRTLTQISQIDNKIGAEAQVLKERADKQKQMIAQMEMEREDLKAIYGKLKDVRQSKMINIKQQDMSSSKLGFLMGVFRQGQLMIENQEIHFKESQAVNSMEQKEIHIAFLNNQMLARDHVINEQKELLNQNNIPSNFIQYNYLKNIKEVSNEAKIHFPIINKNLQVSYSQPGLNKKGGVHKQRIYGSQNNSRKNLYQNPNANNRYNSNNNNNNNYNNNMGGGFGGGGQMGNYSAIQQNQDAQVYHYKKDYQQHKKNQQDYLLDHKYKNQEKLREFKEKQKEEKLRQIEYIDQQNELNSPLQSPQLPNISQNQSNKLVYKNGKLARDDQHLIDMENKKIQYKQNQINAKERQQQFLFEYKKRQQESQQQKHLNKYKKQHSQTDLNTSDQQINNHNNNQDYQFARNGNKKNSRKITQNSRLNSPNQSLNISRNVITPSERMSPYRKHMLDNDDSFMLQSAHKVKNTKEIIKNLEENAPQRSLLKQKMNLNKVLDEDRNLDPLYKDRDVRGQVNMQWHYKESPYVKSFKKQNDSNKVKVERLRDMNINTDHVLNDSGATKQGKDRVNSRFQKYNNGQQSSKFSKKKL